MIHLVHMLQRRFKDRPWGVVLPLVLVAAAGLLAGLGLLLAN